MRALLPVGETIWIEDCRRHGVITGVVGLGSTAVYVCQIDDAGKGRDWASVPCEQAAPWKPTEEAVQ